MSSYVSYYMRAGVSMEVMDEKEDFIIVLCPFIDGRIVRNFF